MDAVGSIEHWKIITDFPGYEVSSFGRMRRATDGSNSKAGKLLKTPLSSVGYPHITLHRNCQFRGFDVHRLVAVMFIGSPPFKGAQVAHFDGSKTNNRVDNLRWTDARGNSDDKRRHGRMAVGEDAYQSKLTARAVRDIRNSKEEQRVLARKYGVSQRAVWNALHRVTWKHV